MHADGKQFKVAPGTALWLDKRPGEVGSELTFHQVALIAEGDQLRIGTPYLDKVHVKARVLGEAKDPKGIVFKKKRRKGYKVKNTYRKHYTHIEILDIVSTI